MGASLSRFVANAPPPDGAPATKRPRPASGKEAPFVRVLEAESNVTTILGYAGYRTVLTLETLCPRARRVVRGARVELDVSSETNIPLAAVIAVRGELFEARRAGLEDVDTYSFTFNDWSHRASDVVYRGDRPLLLSPRPRGIAVVNGLATADRDVARSACAVAAADRRHAALLALGYVNVKLGVRRGDPAGVGAKTSLIQSIQAHARARTARSVIVEDVPADLLDAMGGEMAIPRRLVEAAGRREAPRQPRCHGTRAHLDRAIRQAARASAVLNEPSMRRLLVFFWKSMSHHGFGGLSEAVFAEEVCEPVGVGASAAAVWQEAMSGILLPLYAVFAAAGSSGHREDGDVRKGDVPRLVGFDWLWSAVSAFALAWLARDAATCFSRTHFIAATSFENFVIRHKDSVFSNDHGSWSLALAVLDELKTRRDGETSDEAGAQRVNDAVQSLLNPSRFHEITVGDDVEYTLGDPEGGDEHEWTSGTVVRMDKCKVVVRVGEQETEVFSGQLRLVEERPCPAVVLLAHAIADHRHDVVRLILSYASHPLSYVVGEPGKALAIRTDKRCTALDHAIVARNPVGVGLLWAAYAKSDDEKLGRAWRAVLATCPFLELVTNEKGKAAAVFSPSERVDLSCALRSAPYPFRQRLNPWVAFEGWSRATPIPAAVFDNDIYGVRSYLNHHAAAVRRARVIARPWQMVSSLWRANTLSGDPRLSAMHDYEKHARVVLVSACKFGRADIVRELLTRNVNLDATWLPASVAIAEGHNDCLELLLSANAKSLEPIISYFAPEADFFKRQKGKRVLLQAVSMGNVAAIDLLRSAGVPLSFGDTLDENPLTASCCIGQPEIVRAVLRDQAVVAAVMERRSECFHIAARYGNASCLAVLFEKFTLAQAPAQSIFGDFPPLTLAAIGDDFATVQILLGQPEIDVDEAAPGNKTPLMIASGNHNVDITAALLARGADVGIPFIEPSEFNDALQYALQLGQSKVPTASEAANAASTVRLFLQQRPGMFAPHFLRYMKKKSLIYSILKEFLDDDASLVFQKDDIGLTPLHMYVYFTVTFNAIALLGNALDECVSLLVERGADTEAKTTSSATTDDNRYLFCGATYPVASGMTPMDIARQCGVESQRSDAVALLEFAIKKRDAAL